MKEALKKGQLVEETSVLGIIFEFVKQHELIQHIINGVSIGSIYALVALGYTLVYGILQLINFAHSDVYMLGAFASYYAVSFLGLNDYSSPVALFTMLFVAMAFCSLIGFSIEKLAYRPLRNAPKINVLITAIGVSLFIQYSSQLVFGPDPKPYPTIIENKPVFYIFNEAVLSLDIVILSVSVIMMVILNYIVFHTQMGRAMRAVSANPKVASLMGIQVEKVISFTFAVGSALAAVGAVLIALKLPRIDPLMGMGIGTKAFVAAVLGGIGNIMGAVLGAIIMGLSEELVVVFFSSTYKDALAFAILILILIFKPAGLLGSRSVEKV